MPQSYSYHSDAEAQYEDGRYQSPKEAAYDPYGDTYDNGQYSDEDPDKSTKRACTILLVLLVLLGVTAGILFGVVKIQNKFGSHVSAGQSSGNPTTSPTSVAPT